jgi:probable HAF family extracellular repeat protein
LTQVTMQAADGAVDATAAGFPVYNVTDIGPVGDIATASVWLGDSGLVVGASQGTPAFEWMPTSSNGTTGHATPLDVFGSPVVIPSGVNARGDIAGTYLAEDGHAHGFLVHNGQAHDIGTLGGPSSVADAINNNGLVVGASETAAGAINAISYDGTLHDLGTAHQHDQYSEAFSVNDFGVAAGRSGPQPDASVAATFVNGHVQSLGTLGGDTSSSTDINNLNLIVGFSAKKTGAEHGFIYGSLLPGSKMKDLGTLGGTNSIAASINDKGVIVGQADTRATIRTGLSDAFVDILGAKMFDLNNLIPSEAQSHWDLVQALSINQRGQIAGIGLENGSPHAFLLTPTS